MAEQHDFVTQKECEQRRANIGRDYAALDERVRKAEIAETKYDERIKTLFTLSKLILGIASTVLASLIILIIKGALNI